MSHGGEILGLGGEAATEPSFDSAMRGYERKQVERYVTRAENEIAALLNDREQAYSQIQAMSAQVKGLQTELTQARRNAGMNGEVSFRHLGPRVEQILALAEEQGEAIKASAADDIASRLAEAERIRAEAEAHAHNGIRDFEIALAARRAEEEKADAAKRAASDKALAAARQSAEQMRAEAEAVLARSRNEGKHIIEKATQDAQRARAEVDGYVQSTRVQTDQELKALREKTTQEITTTRTEAEREQAE
ncbi:MAG TPA: Laminin subunit beta-1, partial [Actinoplanes sp.]|nr:Laminin subunit beta-1 [Actinoplanes sp.]